MESSAGLPLANQKQCPQCGALYPDDVRFCTHDGAILSQQGVDTNMVGRVLGGKYRVERLIGSGGMGDVYLVRHMQLDQMRAVKRMQCATIGNAANLERFRREARQQGKIRHPNVATLYDFEEENDGSCFLVMEFVDGQSLGDLIRAPEPIPVARVASIVSQTAAALDAAHEEGVVHRDLKPDNVLIARARDSTDLVKLVDFGIATLIGESGRSSRITSTGFVIGTPRYMSPEQLNPRADQSIDGRSDTYTLALLAMEMLAGELPFGSENLTEILRRAASPPPKFSELPGAKSLPVGLDDVFARGLAIDREMRQTSAGEFAREFAGVLAGAGLITALLPLPPQLPVSSPLVTNAQRESVAANTPVPAPTTTAPPTSTRVRPFAIGISVVLTGALALVFMQGDLGVPPSTAAESTAVSPPPTSGVTNAPAGITSGTPLVDSAKVGQPSFTPVDSSSRSDGARRTAGSGNAATETGTGGKETSANTAIERLRQLEALDEPTTANANERIQEIRRILPLLITPQDSISAELVMIEAMFALQDVSAICARLPRLRRMSTGTNFAPSVALWSDSLPCRRPVR